MSLRILAVGDTVSDRAIEFLERRLRTIRRELAADFVVVNGENAAGTGIFPQQAERILDAGADVITLGNHTFRQPKIADFLDSCPYILRPQNYAPQVPGRGWGVFDTRRGQVLVMNLIGRCNMEFGPDNPFHAADRVLKEAAGLPVLVDFHAEATSEKKAMGYYLDGRAAAVWGTHTHVQTADAAVLSGGTGYLTDLGMTGPEHSVLGVTPEESIRMFLGDPHNRFSTAPGPLRMDCALFELNEQGRCTAAEAMVFPDIPGKQR